MATMVTMVMMAPMVTMATMVTMTTMMTMVMMATMVMMISQRRGKPLDIQGWEHTARTHCGNCNHWSRWPSWILSIILVHDETFPQHQLGWTNFPSQNLWWGVSLLKLLQKLPNVDFPVIRILAPAKCVSVKAGQLQTTLALLLAELPLRGISSCQIGSHGISLSHSQKNHTFSKE